MYGNHSNAYNAYKNNSVNYASREQLLLMLVDGAVKFCKLGRQAILDKDYENANKNIVKAEDIFYELISSLDNSNNMKWIEDLRNIYNFIVKRLIQANIKKELCIMDEIIPLVEDIRNTWYEAYKLSKIK